MREGQGQEGVAEFGATEGAEGVETEGGEVGQEEGMGGVKRDCVEEEGEEGLVGMVQRRWGRETRDLGWRNVPRLNQIRIPLSIPLILNHGLEQTLIALSSLETSPSNHYSHCVLK